MQTYKEPFQVTLILLIIAIFTIGFLFWSSIKIDKNYDELTIKYNNLISLSGDAAKICIKERNEFKEFINLCTKVANDLQSCKQYLQSCEQPVGQVQTQSTEINQLMQLLKLFSAFG